LGDGNSKELFRRLLEAGMQELIDAARSPLSSEDHRAW